MEKIRTITYKLDLPSIVDIHPIFHVSQLKQHVGHNIIQATLPISIIDNDQVLLPQAIIDKRMTKIRNQTT
jgi:hypothetical protein